MCYDPDYQCVWRLTPGKLAQSGLSEGTRMLVDSFPNPSNMALDTAGSCPKSSHTMHREVLSRILVPSRIPTPGKHSSLDIDRQPSAGEDHQSRPAPAKDG